MLSPGVRVDPGAIVRDSVIMFDTHIRAGAVVDRAILDKEVYVGPNAIIGTGNDFDTPNVDEPERLNTGITVVGKRAVIPASARIGRNVRIAEGCAAGRLHVEARQERRQRRAQAAPDAHTQGLTDPAPVPPTIAADDVGAWLAELGLEPIDRGERDGISSWDLRLDGRRRADIRLTLILDPASAILLWVHFAPPFNDSFRVSYRQFLRWNDELPFVKFAALGRRSSRSHRPSCRSRTSTAMRWASPSRACSRSAT